MVTQNGVAVSKPLTEGAVAQIQDSRDYAINRAVPVIMADSIVGTYKYWDKNDLARYEVELRQPGSTYKRVDLDIAEKAYRCQGYGLKTGIAVENSFELGGNPMQTAADYLVDQGLQTIETIGFSKLMTTGLFDNDVSPTTKWDLDTSNPIKDIRGYKVTGRKASRTRMNNAIMTEDVFEALLENQEIIDRLPTNELRILTEEEQLARVFGLDNIYVSRASNIVVNEGASGEAPASFGTESMLLFHKSSGNYVNSPNGALMVVRNNAPGIDGAMGMGITNPYFDEDTDEEIIKLKLQFDIIIPAKSCGVFISNILST